RRLPQVPCQRGELVMLLRGDTHWEDYRCAVALVAPVANLHWRISTVYTVDWPEAQTLLYFLSHTRSLNVSLASLCTGAFCTTGVSTCSIGRGLVKCNPG